MSDRSRALPLALCGAFLLLGLFTLDAYGVTWDEPLHRIWGERIWTYVVTGDASVVEHLPGNGMYYGPIFYILGYGVSEFAHHVLGMSFTAANHLLTLVTATLGLFCTYLLAEALSTRRAALAALLLLALLPPFLAHAHYNPKDIPLLTLTVASLLYATHTYRTRRVLHASLSGAFLGIALSMKPTAVVLLPIIGGAVVADLLARRSWGTPELRSIAATVGITAAAAVVSFVLAWPTLWRDPYLLVETIRYFGIGNFWMGDVLYFGVLVPASELPWHYMPVMMLMSVPLVTIGLATGGSAVVIRRMLRQARRPGEVSGRHAFAGVLLLLWVLLPLLMFMKPGLPRYDGIRQLFFMIPAIMMLAGIGWDALWTRLEDRPQKGRGGRARMAHHAVALAAITWLIAENVRFYPYGGAYVSDAARAALGPHVERSFEVEYWGASYQEGTRWLQSQARRDTVVCVPVGPHLMAWTERDLEQTPAGRIFFDCSNRPDFVMMIARISQWPYEYRHYATETPVFTVSRAGSDLLYVYRVVPEAANPSSP